MLLYNTLTKRFEDTIFGTSIGIYVCGITVYDDCHVGHARTILIFDVLRRYLLHKGYHVTYIQNFTDVDDKIINKAIKEGKRFSEISQLYITSYHRDFDRLNVKRADLYPIATNHIIDMINLIEGLIIKDKAYITAKGVYFSIRSLSSYGSLSNRSIDQLESGARIEIDHDKRDPLDFALWKFSSSAPYWDSPWGKGRPGWHIECSSMALKYLDNKIDIHGGGQDLVFPHHENEKAQSEAFTDNQFAKLWMHVGMVTIDGQKMSKSIGNIIKINDAMNHWGVNPIRLFCLSVHYSKPLDYTEKNLIESLSKWRLIESCIYELKYFINVKDTENERERLREHCETAKEEFENALLKDMNTSLAISAMMKFVNSILNTVDSENISSKDARIALQLFDLYFEILGLKIYHPTDEEIPIIESLIADRDIQRNEKNYIESDRIRKKLLDNYGIELIDHRNRTVWKKIEQIQFKQRN